MNDTWCEMKKSESDIHQSNATSQVNSKILNGEVELVQRSLNVGHCKAQVTEVTGQNPFPAEKVSSERKEEIFT